MTDMPANSCQVLGSFKSAPLTVAAASAADALGYTFSSLKIKEKKRQKAALYIKFA
jgi:hypothetical protein